MNRRYRKKNAGLYLKQGLLALLLLGLTIYLGASSSLVRNLFPPTVTSLSELESASFNKKHTVIKLHSDQIFYTGYDNQTDGKITGHYYYTIQDNQCLFLLLDPQDGTPRQTLTNHKGTFHISENPELYHQLTLSLSKDLDWSSESMRRFSLPMIASQPDYHLLPALLLTIALILCTFIFTLSIVSNFLGYYRCRQRTVHRSQTDTP